MHLSEQRARDLIALERRGGDLLLDFVDMDHSARSKVDDVFLAPCVQLRDDFLPIYTCLSSDCIDLDVMQNRRLLSMIEDGFRSWTVSSDSGDEVTGLCFERVFGVLRCGRSNQSEVQLELCVENAQCSVLECQSA